jgi:light-regulated signal transduction histidine kinase (bacteriophytochrome)
MVQVIRDGSRSLDEMIVGLLAFSRSSSQELQLSQLDMTGLVGAVASEARALYPQPAARIDLQPLPPAMADVTVIRHVWANLIGNAVKFSATRSQPQVQISGRIEDGVAVYSIEDNGVGFDMRHAGKLFGVFKRLHDPDEFPGAGVGLAIAQRIVTRHGGRIWAEATPGTGARFQFSLPVPPVGAPACGSA